MANSTPHQLFLLADHLKLSLLERQRAISLNLEPSKHDANISSSLTTLQQGLEAQEEQQGDNEADNTISDLRRLRKQYEELYAQYHGTAAPTSTITKPNNPNLAPDFTAAQSRPRQSSRNKSVRFRDDPNAPEDPAEVANRTALFADQERYRDEPAPPDQSELDNQQIHSYHKQVLRDQDEQLDQLGASIGRQRLMGIQMGDELDEQNELLEDVERGVDRHTSTLDRARKRLGHVARKSKDNWSWVTIGILIVILVLLIVVLN